MVEDSTKGTIFVDMDEFMKYYFPKEWEEQQEEEEKQRAKAEDRYEEYLANRTLRKIKALLVK